MLSIKKGESDTVRCPTCQSLYDGGEFPNYCPYCAKRQATGNEGGWYERDEIDQMAEQARGRIKPKTSQPVNIETASPFDHCQTPPYAVEPLIPYLPKSIVWEPANADGYLSGALANGGRDVVTSQIENGQNFFDYEPAKWEVQVTNPPYSIKYKWLERSYQLGKPFALLLPVETLAAQAGQKLFKEYGVEIIILSSRVDFKMPDKGWDGGGAQFPVAWFTWGLDLGRQIIFEEMSKVKMNECNNVKSG